MTAAPASITVAVPERLESAFHGESLGDFHPDSLYAACLKPLLIGLGWTGNTRQIVEALPHFANSLELTELRNVLAALGYRTRPKRTKLSALDDRILPCLFVPDQPSTGADQQEQPEGPLAVIGYQGGQWRVFDSSHSAERVIDAGDISGTAYLIATSADEAGSPPPSSWVRGLFTRFRSLIAKALLTTFLLNILALAVPLYVMFLYDKVIGQGAPGLLVPLLMGMILIVGVEVALRYVRSQAIAYAGARTGSLVGAAALQHVLFLPPAQLEGAPVSAQAARLKHFEGIRDFFTGPLATVALELPFGLIILTAIGLLAGPLVFIPVVLLVGFAVAGAILLPKLREKSAEASKLKMERHRFNIETFSNLRTIKELGAEEIWYDRYRDHSATSAAGALELAKITSLIQSLAQLMMMTAGVATLIVGTQLVIAGDLSVGALIATMALVWRSLSPLQQGFVATARLEQARQSAAQVDALMKFDTELKPDTATPTIRQFAGHISFRGVLHRYGPASDPSLAGVSFDISPGEFVAITGGNSAGKSTILKLIAGMYSTQGGKIEIDGLNIRQLDPMNLREAVGYVPQICQLFHGTIAQNLRLSRPVATDDDLTEACRTAGVLDEVRALSNGFETRIGDQRSAHLPAGFLQRLSLARAYLKDSPILLLDEPAQALDQTGDQALVETLQRLKGQKTIVMVSHRPSHLALADRVLSMSEGRLTADAPNTPQVETAAKRIQ